MHYITRFLALCHQAKTVDISLNDPYVLVCGEENITEQCDTYGPLFKVECVRTDHDVETSNKFIHLPIYLQPQKRRNMKVLPTQLNLVKYFVT